MEKEKTTVWVVSLVRLDKNSLAGAPDFRTKVFGDAEKAHEELERLADAMEKTDCTVEWDLPLTTFTAECGTDYYAKGNMKEREVL